MATKRTCTEDGCEKAVTARGLCPMHYRRARLAGTLEQHATLPPRPSRADNPCKLDGCEKPGYALGYCQRHYDAFNRYGDPIGPAERKRLAGPAMCSTNGCDRKAKARGMCDRHYQNATKYGRAVPRRDRPLRERLEEVGWTVAASGCWEWNGGRTVSGYGVFTAERLGYDRSGAHRAMYESIHGPLDPSQHVRHKCDNPPCVNPDHLEPGTPADNMNDMAERMRSGNLWENNGLVCRNGHDVTAPGAVRIVRQKGRKPYRTCAICDTNRKRAYAERKRAARQNLP